MVGVAAGVGGALAAVLLKAEAPGPEAGGADEGEAGEDEDFAAVEIIDGAAIEVRVGEDAVNEDEQRCEINRVVEQFPPHAADLLAGVGGDEHDDKNVGGDGADCVFDGLQWRVDGRDYVDESEAVAVYEKKNDGMDHDGDE